MLPQIGFPLAKRNMRTKATQSIIESLNDFIFGNEINAEIAGKKTGQIQAAGFFDKIGRSTTSENTTCHDRVNESNIADNFRKEVDNAVTAVENGVHDVIFTAVDNVV